MEHYGEIARGCEYSAAAYSHVWCCDILPDMSLGTRAGTALLSLDTLLLVGVGAACAYAIVTLHNNASDLALMRGELTALRSHVDARLASTTAYIQAVEDKEIALSDMLYNEQKRIEELADNVEGFDRTVGRLSGSVETLEKLTTTDPELLQKYSKVYFLNEHYMPADLTVIDEKYDYENGKEVSVQSDMWPFLEDLLEDAWDDGVQLKVLSGYRSFEEQQTLKQHYMVTYGTGANTFSADQGYSEHQLGTTVDFTDENIGENLDTFEGSDAHRWLERNAYKYGFVMSYPENNQYYVYEPWHWRFVGEDLARYLDRQNKHFYDLEQRKIDEYIPTLFDD